MQRAIAIAAALLAVSTLAAAQSPPPPEPPGGPDHPGAAPHVVARFLELTDDQIASWNALVDQREQAAQPIRQALAAVQQQIDDLLAGDDPDPFEVGTLVIERHDLGEQLADVQRTYVEGFESLLDDEQLGRYHFVRRAERAEPLFPAFRAVDLLPPHWR